MLRKYATTTILDARMGTSKGFAKGAHRAVFNYTPRPGYLYVRSRAISSRCNDNFDAFPAEEIEKSYMTFIGKPVMVNHHNEDHRRARGVIIDAALHRDRNPDGSPDTWVELLHEVDAVTFPKLAKAILAGEVDRTSMGCDVQFSKCSACGNVATSPLEYCAHIPGKKGKRIERVDPKTGKRSSQLIFEICSGLSFFENSLLVEQPADPTAYFLGSVETGPGLEALKASVQKMAKTAQLHPYSWNPEGREVPYTFQEGAAYQKANFGTQNQTTAGLFNREKSQPRAGLTREEHEELPQIIHRMADKETIGLHDHFIQKNYDNYASVYDKQGRSIGMGPANSIAGMIHRSLVNGYGDSEKGISHDTLRASPRVARRGPEIDVWGLIKQAEGQDTGFASAAAEGLKNDHVRSFEGRPVPEHGDPVAVYRDLSGAPKSGYPARGSWSIKRQRKNGNAGDLVHAHTVGIHITNAEPTFHEAAREKFKNEEKRGVHAFIKGNVHHYAEPSEKPEGKDWRQVSYYPDISHFFLTDTRNKYHGSDEAAMLGGKMWARGNIKEGDDGPVPQSKFEQPRTGKLWELIYEASVIGDDIYDEDFQRTAAATHPDYANNAEDRNSLLEKHTADGKGVRNILNLVHSAHEGGSVASGMNWYKDAHGMAKSMSEHYRNQEGHAFSKLSPEEALHRTAATVGVYSSSSAPAPNFHMASDAIHHGQAIYSHPTIDEHGVRGNKGFNPKNEGSEYDRHGLPMADEKAAAKINSVLQGGKTIDEAWRDKSGALKAHKTRNYAHLINDPDSVDEKGRDRVVVDRHAIAAAMGWKGNSGELYDKNPKTGRGHGMATTLGSQGGYEKVAQHYRDAADHINSSDEFKPLREHLQKTGLLGPGERVRGHHVQAMAWVEQKKVSEAASRSNGVKPSDQRDIDNFQGHYTERYGAGAHHPQSWQGFVGGDARHGSRKMAYGETKAPTAVDTLRAENCTICGNSTAFDGTQCQVCGYVAPPRPFGDPNTDLAADQDMRKQVLDGDEADPNDPNQQLGQQVGDPDELEDQQKETEAGDNTQIPQLDCDSCGTGIKPASPASEDGTPPYPAEGDVCPVCQKGQLLPGQSESQALGDEEEQEEVEGEQEQDDEEVAQEEEEEEADSPQPPKKKTSSWRPSWWRADPKVSKVAGKYPSRRDRMGNDPDKIKAYKAEYNKGWNRSKNVGSFPDQEKTDHYDDGYLDHACEREKYHFLDCHNPDDHDNCS